MDRGAGREPRIRADGALRAAGGELQRPLATVVIGGWITATFLTLVVLPTVYLWIEKRMGRDA